MAMTQGADGHAATLQFWWPMMLSTLAGLSTSIGGAIAVIRKPSQATMACLLGVAIGVMACVSIVELIVRNAMENNALLVVASAIAGGLAYYLLEPLFPKVEEEDLIKKQGGSNQAPLGNCPLDVTDNAEAESRPPAAGVALRKKARKAVSSATAQLVDARDTGEQGELNGSGPGKQQWLSSAQNSLNGQGSHGGDAGDGHEAVQQGILVSGSTSCDSDGPETVVTLHGHPSHLAPGQTGWIHVADDEPHPPWLHHGPRVAQHASLMRLGLLMAVTMTLHNMPEGFAVAFSAFTDFGPVMAIAIALHNIPEGVIIAAPLYAATNSRWRAMGIATASGLSEPLGALLALLVFRPFITPDRLQYMLACVGGLMLAVCVIELLPEARACRNDRALIIGAGLGAVVMGWTLMVGG